MQKIIENLIKGALKDLKITDVDFVVEHPEDLGNGDYSTNAAMASAKKNKTNPKELAEELTGKPFKLIDKDGSPKGPKRFVNGAGQFFNRPVIKGAVKGFGFGIGLGVDFFVGLFISFGAGFLAGIIITGCVALTVVTRLIVSYNLLAKIRKWLSVSS